MFPVVTYQIFFRAPRGRKEINLKNKIFWYIKKFLLIELTGASVLIEAYLGEKLLQLTLQTLHSLIAAL